MYVLNVGVGEREVEKMPFNVFISSSIPPTSSLPSLPSPLLPSVLYPSFDPLSLLPSSPPPQSEWIHLQSDQLGRYQLNKYTGEIHRDPTATLQDSATHPQMDLINQAYRQVLHDKQAKAKIYTQDSFLLVAMHCVHVLCVYM